MSKPNEENKIDKKVLIVSIAIVLLGIFLFKIPTEKVFEKILTPEIQENFYSKVVIQDTSDGENMVLPTNNISSFESIKTFSRALKYSLSSALFIILSCCIIKNTFVKEDYKRNAKKLIGILTVLTVIFSVFTFYNVVNKEDEYYFDKRNLEGTDNYVSVDKKTTVSNFLHTNTYVDKIRVKVINNLDSINSSIEVLAIFSAVLIVPLNYYQNKYEEYKE